MDTLKKHQEDFIQDLEETYRELNTTETSEEFNFINVGDINNKTNAKEVRAKEILAENKAIQIAHAKVFKKDIKLLAVDLKKLGFEMSDNKLSEKADLFIAFTYNDGKKTLIYFRLGISQKKEITYPNLPNKVTAVYLTSGGGGHYDSVAEAVEKCNLQQSILNIKTQSE